MESSEIKPNNLEQQKQSINPESVEDSQDAKIAITQEVEKSAAEFESSDLEISKAEAGDEFIASKDIEDIKEEINFDEQLENLNAEARILKQETEQQIEWTALGEEHQFDENN